MVNSALEEGEDYGKMKKSIVVSFVDKILFPKIPGLHTKFQLIDSGEEAVRMSEYVYKKVTENDLARQMLGLEDITK